MTMSLQGMTMSRLKTTPGTWVQHPSVSWVFVLELPSGGWLVRNDQTGSYEAALNKEELIRKIVSASVSEHHFALGELVHKATTAVGIKPCKPCELRRAWLNQLFRK